MPKQHKSKKKLIIPTEHEEQKAVINWSSYQLNKYPELKWLYAVPNAAKRSPRLGAWMKEEGMKAGVSDLCLPVARGGYHALYIEMKALDGTTTEAQREFLMDMKDLGNQAVACWGFEAAKDEIIKYLKGA